MMFTRDKIIVTATLTLVLSAFIFSPVYAAGVVPEPPPLFAPPQDAKPNLSGAIQYTGDAESQDAAKVAEERAKQERAQLEAEGDDVVDTAPSTSPFSAASAPWRIGILFGALIAIGLVAWFFLRKRRGPSSK